LGLQSTHPPGNFLRTPLITAWRFGITIYSSLHITYQLFVSTFYNQWIAKECNCIALLAMKHVYCIQCNAANTAFIIECQISWFAIKTFTLCSLFKTTYFQVIIPRQICRQHQTLLTSQT